MEKGYELFTNIFVNCVLYKADFQWLKVSQPLARSLGKLITLTRFLHLMLKRGA